MKSIFKLLGKIFSLKNLFHYDNILVILSLFCFGFLLSNISLSVFDPIGEAFADVQFTDINYSYLGKNDDLRGVKDGKQKLDTNIVIVNIGDLKRPGIANLISTISAYSPKVIGVDVLFDREKDSLTDNVLAKAIKKAGNVVLVSKGTGGANPKTKTYDSIIRPIAKFAENAKYGIANMALADEGNDLEQFKICRAFVSGSYLKDGTYKPCFSTTVAQEYDVEKAQKIIERNKFEEIINYSGNLFVEFSQRNTFPLFLGKDYREVFADDFTNPEALKKTFKNKIVLLGYLGHQIDEVNDNHDKFFTPFNQKYVGKASIDMYGVVIHANIITMILNGRYVSKMPEWLSHLVGFLITYLTFAAFRPIYNDHKIWYDGVTKVISFFIVIIITFLIGFIFAAFNYKMAFPGIYMGAILLAGDYMEIYHGLFVNIAKKLRKKIINED